MRFPRTCHQASNLVHVCDVFDALRTDRPYRGAWETERVLGLLDEGSGTEFDYELAQSFIRMMRQWEGHIAEVHQEDEALPIGAPVEPTNEDGPGQPSAPAPGEGPQPLAS